MPRAYPPNRGRDLRTARAAAKPGGNGGAGQIARIDTLTQTARASWFGLLSFLAFVGVTLMGVDTPDFFIPERQTQLPLVGVSIPTRLFFWVAPPLSLLLYAYFHLHLMKLWEALGEADARQGDAHLGDRITPWLVSDFALRRRADHALRDRPLRKTSHLAILFLAFVSAPLILFALWWLSFPARSEAMTVLSAGLSLSVAAYVGLKSWRYMKAQTERPDVSGFGTPTATRVFWLVLAVTAAFGWFRTEGTLDHYARAWFGVDPTDLAAENRPWWSGTPYPAFLAPVDLAHYNFVDAPPDLHTHQAARLDFWRAWCRSQGVPPGGCGTPADTEYGEFLAQQRAQWCHGPLGLAPDPDGARCRARFRDLRRAYEAAWTLKRTADHRALTDRILRGADLRGALLRFARLDSAVLRGTRLEGANLREARLESAVLREARLDGAILRLTWLENADIRDARLDGAFLDRTRLDGARMGGARLSRALLQETELGGAELAGIRLDGAGLWKTDLSALPPETLAQAFGDGSVTLPDGLEAGQPPLAHWPAEALGRRAFERRWKAWQAASGYRDEDHDGDGDRDGGNG